MYKRSLLLFVVVALLTALFVLPVLGEPFAYRIKEGDTLAKVAKETGISLDNLLAWNEWVESPNAVLKAGKLVVLRNPYGRAQFETDPELQRVSNMLTEFFGARIAKNMDVASKYASDDALSKYTEGDLSLFGTSTPSYARFAVCSVEKVDDTFNAVVRVYEKVEGKEVGYFDESLVVANVNDEFKVVDAKRGEYVNVYVVERGDNLWNIAKKLGMKSDGEIASFVKKVMELNEIKDKDFLKAHEVLRLP